jgi:hypothetical protein
MSTLVSLAMVWVFCGALYGMMALEAQHVMADWKPFPETSLSLMTVLENPDLLGETLPPLIDHGAHGFASGMAPEAICLYAAWLYPHTSSFYFIYSDQQEVRYRCHP